MRDHALFDKIDLHLIRVLHTVLTERSVSRAAVRLGMHQPAVSAALKRLRDLSGDPLLVRSGASMMPTDAALRMVEPAGAILRAAEALFSDARGFDPRTATRTFRVAASDYLDPLFLPQLVARIKVEAPLCPIEILPLSADAHYHAHLAQGDVDVVIGNWPRPPDDLHMGRLFGDEVVCLVGKDHPAVRRGWDVESWLAAEHIAPTPTHPGARGRDRRPPGQPGHAAPHHGALRAFQPHPQHRGIELACADHRPPVLRAVCGAAAPGHPAVPGAVSPAHVLPAVACPHASLGRRGLAARLRENRGCFATKRIAAWAC